MDQTHPKKMNTHAYIYIHVHTLLLLAYAATKAAWVLQTIHTYTHTHSCTHLIGIRGHEGRARVHARVQVVELVEGVHVGELLGGGARLVGVPGVEA